MDRELKCKCSRCGKKYNNNGYSDGPNAIAFGINDGNGFDLAYDIYTLCPECIDELMMFLDKKKSNTCSDTKNFNINKFPETLDDLKKLLDSIDIYLIVNYRRTDGKILFYFLDRNDGNVRIYSKSIPSWVCYSLPESELVEILYESIKEKINITI